MAPCSRYWLRFEDEYQSIKQILAAMSDLKRQTTLQGLILEGHEEAEQTGNDTTPHAALMYNRYLFDHPEQPLLYGREPHQCIKGFRWFVKKHRKMLKKRGMSDEQFFRTIFCDIEWADYDRMDIDVEENVGPRGEPW